MAENISEDRVIGRIGITLKDEYDPNVTYTKLNQVTYEGSSYTLKVKEATGIVPSNKDYWSCSAKKGDKGDTGPQGEQGIQGKTGPQGPEGKQGPQGIQGKVGPQGPAGQDGVDGRDGVDGHTPVKGEDYFTELEKTEFKNAVVADSKTDIDIYTANKKKEFNDNSTAKLKEYNDNATEKINTFNSNAEAKLNEFNENAESYEKRIAELETENSELAQQLPWRTTAIADSIHVEDSAKYSRNKLDLFGNLEQETSVMGNNIFDGIMEIGSINYSTGVDTDNTNTIRSKNYIDISDLTILRVVRNDGNVTNEHSVGFRLYDANKNFIASKATTLGSATNLSDYTDLEGYKYVRFIVTNTADTETYRYGLNKDASTTYEEFIPNKPSTKYPSPIQVATGVQKIRNCRKNILPTRNVTTTKNELTFAVNKDGTITVNGTATAQTIFPINTIPAGTQQTERLLANTYTLSAGTDCSSNTYFIQGIYTENNTQIYPSTASNNSKTFVVKENTFLGAGIIVRAGVTCNNIIFKPQLEIGDFATAYEPYKCEEITPDLKSIELCKIGDYRDYIYKNKTDNNWYKKEFIYKLILTGNETFGNSYGVNLFNTLNIPDTIAKTGGYSNYYKYNSAQSGIDANLANGEFAIQFSTYNLQTKLFIKNTDFSNVTSFKERLKELYNANKPLTVYYPLKTAVDIQITDEVLIEQLEKLYNLQLEQGTNNIFIESENGVTAEMQLTYMQDRKMLEDAKDKQYNDRLTAIEDLLSTTETSAMLLDNLQNDLEKEVE